MFASHIDLRQEREPLWMLLLVYGAWRATLDLCYVYLMYPVYDYIGFAYQPDTWQLAESIAWQILLVSLTPRDTRTPSTFFSHIFLSMVLTPILSYFAWSGVPREGFYILMLGALTLLAAMRAMPPLVIGVSVRNGHSLAMNVCLALVAVAVLSLVARGGLANLNFDLTRVYEFREEGGDGLYQGAWAYLYSWAGGSVTMTLLAYALSTRRRLLALGALAAQVFLFATTSNKIFLFLPVVVIGVFVVLKTRRPVFTFNLLLTLAFATISVLLVSLELAFVADLIIRRTMFTPAFLTFTYMDFFSQHDFIYRSNSLLSLASEYPYDTRSTGLVIGNYLGTPQDNAVTGYLGSAYMHWGAIGVGVASVALAGILRFLDGCRTRGLTAVFVITMSIAGVRTVMAEADLVTGVISHGLGVTLFVLALFAADSKLDAATTGAPAQGTPA